MEAVAMPAVRHDNAELAATLRELAARLEIDGVAYVPRSYRRAADTVERQYRPVAEIYSEDGAVGLEALAGVGSHIARTLAEILDTGAASRLERLRRETPVDVMELLAVDGIGPKRVKTLWKGLEVRTVEDLERAVAAHWVRDLPGFGSASEERLRQILRFRRLGDQRTPLKQAAALAEDLRREVEQHPHVTRCDVAGSIRRGRSSVGDIDLVAASTDASAVARDFLARSDIAVAYNKGPNRLSVALDVGIDVDLRIVPPESFGSALLYFTGNRAHTLALRQLARAEGLRLNEYGLFRGGRKIAGETEEGIYAALSLPYLPPEDRLGGAEIRDALRTARKETR
jgi:DNA polymerase (family 10)